MRTLFAAVVMFGLGTVAAVAAAATHWDIPTAAREGTLHARNIAEFAKNIGERTGGSLQVTVHPGESLIKLADTAGAIRRRAVPAGALPASELDGEMPVLAADRAPFLGVGFDGSAKLFAAQKSILQKDLAHDGLVLLYSVASPPPGLFADRKIEVPGDFNGLRVAAPNPMIKRAVELLGATPVMLPPGTDPLAAARAGKIDAFFASAPAGAGGKAWSVLGYFHDFQAWLPREVMVANKDALGDLSSAQRSAVQAAAAAAEGRGTDWSKAAAREATALLAKNGMTVVPTAKALQPLLTQVGRTVGKEWAAGDGPEAKALLVALDKK